MLRKKRDTLFFAIKEKLKRSEFEEMSKLYDELYKQADLALKKYDPCKIQNGRCINTYPCCDGTCGYLSKKTGCTVKSLACKLHLCERARKASPKCAKILDALARKADTNKHICLTVGGSLKDDLLAWSELV